jgi:hypothetical protein
MVCYRNQLGRLAWFSQSDAIADASETKLNVQCEEAILCREATVL